MRLPDMRKLFTDRPQDDLEMVVVGLVKYKYLRNYSANCLHTGIVYLCISLDVYLFH